MEVAPCPKCYDPEEGVNRGSYCYTTSGTPHYTFCDLCCRHDQGWWQLTELHGADKAGLWCCRAGCGHTIEQAEYEERMGLDTSPKPLSRPSALAG